MRLFSPDSKLMISMARLGDLTILNFLYLMTCLPVFTIGAATTALYTVSFRNTRDWGNGQIKAYFQAFRDNFKQGTALWMILLVCGGAAFLDAWLFHRLTGPVQKLYIVFAVLFALVLLAGSYVFPLLSQFENGNKGTLKNALLLSIGYLPRSLLMAAMNVFPFYFLATSWIVFFKSAFLWVFWYFSSVAYFNALLLKKVFNPYRNEEDAQ